MRKGKIDRAIDFIEYITKNMNKENLSLLYRINSVKRERIELFCDFTIHLNDLIISTYLGDDITLDTDKKNHFKWCWGKVVESFKKEGIYFLNCDELYEYFLTFYQESFYDEVKTEENVYRIEDFWIELFDFDKPKTMSEYESLVELYKIFSKSFMVN